MHIKNSRLDNWAHESLYIYNISFGRKIEPKTSVILNFVFNILNINFSFLSGVSYRARLLISIRTEITDNIDLSPAAVELEPTTPINEESYAKNEEFFLFTTILDASMIDKKLGDKPVYFEVSIGNAGNAIDGHNTSTKEHYDSDSDELGKRLSYNRAKVCAYQ